MREDYFGEDSFRLPSQSYSFFSLQTPLQMVKYKFFIFYDNNGNDKMEDREFISVIVWVLHVPPDPHTTGLCFCWKTVEFLGYRACWEEVRPLELYS